MGWTERQQRCAIAAASRAGWNDMQRYTAMLHCGCPKCPKGQVSLKNKANPHAAFEQYMALAESSAAQIGERIYPPKGFSSWAQVVDASRTRVIHLINEICEEGRLVLNKHLGDGGLDGFAQRMTRRDQSPCGMPLAKERLVDCDGGQLYRIVEGLKGWLGREFVDRGIEPASFTLHWHARKRLEEIQKRIA